MPSPFPGMDPYLEHPFIWSGLHNRLIVAIADEISAQVSQRYYVDIEQRVYVGELDDPRSSRRPDVSVVSSSTNGGLQGIDAMPQPEGLGTQVITVELPVPDEIREAYLEVRDAHSGNLVTALEILSPTNKRAGRGRELYESKRRRILETSTNLIEIDLLRAGEPMRFFYASGNVSSDYRILVRRGGRSTATLYAFGVMHPIPSFELPLQLEDFEPVIDIGKLLESIYQRARYHMRVNYSDDPVPPLSEADAAWADELLRESNLR